MGLKQLYLQLRVMRSNKKRRSPKNRLWGNKRRKKTHVVSHDEKLNRIDRLNPAGSHLVNNVNEERNVPEITNETYRDYLELMVSSVEGPLIGWKVLPTPSFYRPPSLPPLCIPYSARKTPWSILSRIWRGEVAKVELHMIAISHKGSTPGSANKQRHDKYEMYNEEKNSLTVRVFFSCLEDVLIPFDEKERTKPKDFVGIVPLSMKIKTGRYRPVNDNKNLHGFEYCIDTYGARYFKRNEQKYYLLGDYLTVESILSALVHSGRTNHFVHSWSYNCQLKHNIMKQVGSRIPRERKTKANGWDEKQQVRFEAHEQSKEENGLKMCVADVVCFLKCIQNAFDVHGLPESPMRSAWDDWNVFQTTNSKPPAEEQFCTNTIQRAIEFEGIQNESEREHFISKMKRFHYMLIMVSSQMIQDEKLHQQYLCLVHGRASLNLMIAPFQRVSFLTYYQHFGRCYREYSGQNKKAEAMMALLYATSDLWSGVMPEERTSLLALPHVGKKKTAVTLNACGRYKNVGAGADTHCFKCCRYLIKTILGINDGKKVEEKIEQVFFHLPVYPGREAK